MAWDVAEFQDQVQLATGQMGLNDRVLGWLNRVLMEVAKKAYWTKLIKSVTTIVPTASDDTLNGVWLTNTDDLGEANITSLHRIEVTNSGSECLAKHTTTQDLYARYHAALVDYASGNDVTHYCVPQWSEGGSGAVRHQYPEIAVYPVGVAATTTTKAYFSTVPDKLTGGSSTHWMLTKYPHLFMAGTLRYAFLFLGDLQSYMIWKQRFVNGMKDMVMSEESMVANAPAFGGVFPEVLTRGVD